MLANPQQHPPHLAVRHFQPRGGGYLRQMLLLYLVQHFQSVPFSLAQSDSLRLHGDLGHPCKRTFLLCTNRTFSFCADRRCGGSLTWVFLLNKMCGTCPALIPFSDKLFRTTASSRRSVVAEWVSFIEPRTRNW